MASTRTDYTHYCSELASRGYVVAAIEHRDGSAPGSTVAKKDGTFEQVFHITPDFLNPEPETAEFKQMQLAFRQAEVEETIRILRSLNDGAGEKILQSNPRKEGIHLGQWRDKLDFDQLIMAGHSYGATLALQTLKDAPSNTLPIRGAIILDPGKQSGPLNHEISVPVLIIHSNSWSSRHSVFFGRPHFDVVKELAKGVLTRGQPTWFITSLGTSHPSVTDAPLIEPLLLSWTTGSSIDAKEGVNQYVRVSDEFMQYLSFERKPVTGILGEAVSHTAYNLIDESRKTPLPRNISRFWQIHVAPTGLED
ncbi:MAG: hypothetical protein Q9227_001207 [Pyrenula ochraceoflavens]